MEKGGKQRFKRLVKFLKEKKIIFHFYHIAIIALCATILYKINDGINFMYHCLQTIDNHLYQVYILLMSVASKGNTIL